MYYQTTSPSSISNCLADFDGRGNTDVILAAHKKTDFSNNKLQYYDEYAYPAASCCDMLCLVGTNQGDWYLPAMGELGYLCARKKIITSAISTVKSLYSIGIDSLEGTYFSSAEYNERYCRAINFSTGKITIYPKNKSASVYAWLQVDPNDQEAH